MGVPKIPGLVMTTEPPKFEPTDEMLKLKAAYWVRTGTAVMAGPPTAASVAAVMDDPRIRDWWAKPGFAAWFQIRTSWEERAEYLAHKALDRAEQLLQDVDPKVASAQVQLIKAIIEFSNRAPAKVKETKMLDADINKLDKSQLKEFIKQKSSMLGSDHGQEN